MPKSKLHFTNTLLISVIPFILSTWCSSENHSLSSINESQISLTSGIATKQSPPDQRNEPEIHVVISEIPIPKEYHIDVTAMSQYPEYVNGCEITSLAMLTNYLKLPYDRQQLIDMLAKDETPLQQDEDNSILIWGDPNLGFVGDITGKQMGYGVYHKPIADVLNEISHGQALDLTGEAFSKVEKQVSLDYPVIIWTTSSFTPVDNWVEWKTKDGNTVHATFEEHAVLLVGYDEENVYINNPLNGEKAVKIAKQPFISSWEQLGKQALTYAPVPN
ncbi:C39 family peptidase [Paenibacillus sp. WC2504]|uniref:C39 family peptidase n=1 Tax=Paenibacillus sp. WC2504 TaxID=3461403 RepID=UPI004045B2CB